MFRTLIFSAGGLVKEFRARGSAQGFTKGSRSGVTLCRGFGKGLEQEAQRRGFS